jgi:putative transcriptional regulator
MSDETTMIRARLLADGTVVQVLPDGTERPFEEEDGTDWARLDAMTEEEIEANALADPDSAPETEEEIAAMWGGEYLKGVRSRLNLTQEQFSSQFGIPLGTLRDWERGASVPDASARTLLRVIAREPEAVLRALAS